MSTFLNPYRIIPIQNSDQFEDFCCEVARDWFGDFAAQRYGRSGQKQGGIDINTTNREITATNNRGGAQKVVIQCKYKKDPKNFRSAEAIRELKQDLESAIASHQFDVFIYASTLERDTELQDKADEFSRTYNKNVQIWFWDDLEKAVRTYPRLQRMYAEGSISSGVQLLHPDFLKSLESRQADPFQFYTAKVDGDWQWLGVWKGLAAQRNCRPAIDAMLDTLFAKPFLDTKIAAVVYGEGGSGKSTLLRQIALDRAKQGYICWWVVNMDSFINHDAKSISENNHPRHLVFVEDWYRNMKDKSGTELFTWLKGQRNVLVLIGDRSFQSSVYGSYCYHDSKYQLLPSENRIVLKHIATSSKDYRAILDELGALKKLLDHAALFMILFVAATLLKDRDKHTDIDLKDGVLTAFQKIVANKLLVIEEDENHYGLGKALYLLANIYASEKMGYTLFPEDFFLKTAAFLGKNKELIERIAMDGYPDEVNALVNKRTVVTKSIGTLHFIEFNHDVLAEQGIVHAQEHKAELAKTLKLENYSLTKLLNTITGNVDPNGAILLWLWLHTERGLAVDGKAMERLQYILEKNLAQITNGSLFKAVIFILPPKDLRIRICHYILEQPLFYMLPAHMVITAMKFVEKPMIQKVVTTILSQADFFSTLPYQIVSTALNKAEAEAAKTAAEKILAQADFFSTLPYQIVSTALNKAGAEAVKTAAEKILAQADFFSTLPYQIVSTALNKAGAEAVKTAAEEILSQADFFSTLPYQIVSTALNKAGAEAVKTAAEEILSQADFFKNLDKEIVSTALKKAGAEAAKTAAEEILSQADFFSTLPYQIVSTALNKAGAEAVKTAAEEILSQADFFKNLDKEIVSTALKKAGAEAAKTAAEEILSQADFFSTLPYQIVSTALNKAGAEAVKTAAEEILSQADFFSTLPYQIVSTALNKAGAEAVKTAAEEILSQADFFKNLDKEIVSTALNKAGAEAVKTAAEEILSQADFFKNLDKEIVSTALKKAGAEAVKTAAEEILSQADFFKNLDKEIVSTALNKAGAEAAKTAAEKILAQADFFSTLPCQIVSTALKKAGAEAAKTAAEEILSQADFFSTLPYQIVSTALQILGREESAFQAARTILNNLKQIHTFLVFQAIKTLLHSNKEEDRVLIHKVVDEINHHLRSESKGFNRLYYDLLYLPLFDIPTHQEKVRRVFSGYRPTAQRHAKYNAYRVLNCYNEYPGISYFQAEVKALSYRILSGCIADIECQRKEHPQELTFGHIGYALQHPALVAEAAQAKEHLLVYGQQYPDFQQSALYKEAAGMAVDLEGEELEFKDTIPNSNNKMHRINR